MVGTGRLCAICYYPLAHQKLGMVWRMPVGCFIRPFGSSCDLWRHRRRSSMKGGWASTCIDNNVFSEVPRQVWRQDPKSPTSKSSLKVPDPCMRPRMELSNAPRLGKVGGSPFRRRNDMWSRCTRRTEATGDPGVRAPSDMIHFLPGFPPCPNRGYIESFPVVPNPT